MVCTIACFTVDFGENFNFGLILLFFFNSNFALIFIKDSFMFVCFDIICDETINRPDQCMDKIGKHGLSLNDVLADFIRLIKKIYSIILKQMMTHLGGLDRTLHREYAALLDLSIYVETKQLGTKM